MNIVQEGDPVLREKAELINPEDITSTKVQDVISRMSAALASQKDGVAIAAPQIGESLRIFVVSKKVFALMDKHKFNEDKEEIDPQNYRDKVFINPEIINTSSKKVGLDEGCLSVRWKYGKVQRYKQATVRAYDGEGKQFEMGASGLLSQIFQHEIDHLDGILFIDKAKDLEKIDPNEIKVQESGD